VPAGEVTFTLHLLTNVNLPVAPDCDPYCIAGSPLEGQEETVTASVDFAADGSQALTVTVD
ncbi:MAG: hypothetical protein JRI68_34600, partial [Deltaproteobacteria bacterium]|nr:hypothetical protein [Deltaproteobacteria bacterium]